MAIIGSMIASAGGAALGKFLDKKLSYKKDGTQTKYGKFQDKTGGALSLSKIGAIGGKIIGGFAPFQLGGEVQSTMRISGLKPRQDQTKRLNYQGLDPRYY